ncbi:hypothetical protein [Mesobacillus maritimus]|uniref:hypothetical protein n=1 Tax=Mesobacillus maritimus TaxID=1643336 RepID=UPI003850092D
MTVDELKGIIDEIQQKLNQLNEKEIRHQKKVENEIHLHIHNVQIDSLTLDELSYHLDNIDIKELSGMLNLGNSFSPKIQSSKNQSSFKSEDSTKVKKTEQEEIKKEGLNQKQTPESLRTVDSITVRIGDKDIDYSIGT